MRNIMMILFGLSLGGWAQAGQVICSGQDFGYDFTLRAKVSGSAVTGDITATVMQNGQVLTKQTLRPTSSHIVSGRSIAFTGTNDQITGVVTATYSNGKYVGELVANTSQGDFDVQVTCALTGS